MIPLLLLGAALAGPVAAPPTPAPPVLIVGFQDRPGDADCPPLQARVGDCVERVDLLDPASIFDDVNTLSRAAWEALGRLHFGLWEDLAHQGLGEGSALALTLGKAGYTQLPEARDLWQDVRRGPHIAAPDRQRWLPASTWGLGGAGVWRPIKVHQPAGLPAPTPTVLMKGRFALRLGYDGRPHDYDLMDADPGSSGPFFEQVFPFRRSSDRAGALLGDFDLPDAVAAWVGDESQAEHLRAALGETLMARDDYASLKRVASEEFQSFSRLLGVVIAQYALQDYTTNQMRVLGALTLMRGAPGGPDATQGRTRDLVAASLGQTDDAEALGQRLDESVFALQGGFQLRYDQLPEPVVERWLGRLGTSVDPAALNEGARALLGDLMRPGAAPVPSADPDAVRAWARDALKPGADQDALAGQVLALALQLRVESLPATARDASETWILLDHVQDAVSSTLDPSGASQLSPAAYAAATTAQWAGVLGRHGHHTRAMGQGLGAVDPTSICTTGDGAKALEEPTIGAVHLDVLLDAPSGLGSAEDVLWAARAQTPVLALDDPSVTRPTVTALVALPGEHTLYRVRWTVWSGWHLWWTAQGLGELTRASARTGALCEDMVLAPASLAPTVARAALLDGELRPSTPVYRRDVRRARHELEKKRREPGADLTADEAISGASSAGASAVKSGKAAQSAVEGFQSSGDPTDLTSAASGLLRSSAADLPDEGEVDERVLWLRSLARPGLEALARSGALLEVLELDEASHRLADRRPRTPYLRVASRAARQRVHGAAWALYLSPVVTALRLAPATRPRDSVDSDAPSPRWRRLPTQDWALSGSVAAFPWRLSETTCSSTSSDLDVVVSCDGAGDTYVSQGLSADLAAIGTRWLSGQPRWAVEAGLAVHLDVVLPGEAVLDDSGTVYDWAFRPQAGVVLGARVAPRPVDLVTRALPGPWGADGPDGFSPLHRSELGLRGGFLSGPGYNGLEATALGELWWASALRRERSSQASFTPYHPAALLGPFVRYQYGFTLIDGGGDELLSLDGSHTVFVGVRGSVRLAAQPSLPEVPQ